MSSGLLALLSYVVLMLACLLLVAFGELFCLALHNRFQLRMCSYCSPLPATSSDGNSGFSLVLHLVCPK
jgi:hypothetical protein